MGPFRYCRHALKSLGILLERFPVFLRLAALPMLASLLAEAVSPRHPVMGGIVDLLARGVFAVAWLRLVALDEAPGKAAPFRLGRREVLAALGWMLAEVFVTFPAHLLGASLAMATGLAMPDLVMPLLGLFHLLLGAAYLLPAEAALEDERHPQGWRLPEMIMKGGLAAGIAAALVWLPINLLQEGLWLLPELDLADGFTLRQAAAVIDRFPAMALMAGTMALIWREQAAGPLD